MAVRRQPLAVLQDENADINRGKGTQKPQQPDLSRRAGIVRRTALGDLTNRVPATAFKPMKAQGKNPRYEPDKWALEGIEKVHYSGKDMEAFMEKNAEEEVNRRVAQALSYRSELPYFLPGSLQKDSPATTYILELDPVEDLCKKGDSPFDDMKLEDVDYDESFLGCLEILQNASNKWPGIIKDCVY